VRGRAVRMILSNSLASSSMIILLVMAQKPCYSSRINIALAFYLNIQSNPANFHKPITNLSL